MPAEKYIVAANRISPAQAGDSEMKVLERNEVSAFKRSALSIRVASFPRKQDRSNSSKMGARSFSRWRWSLESL